MYQTLSLSARMVLPLLSAVGFGGITALAQDESGVQLEDIIAGIESRDSQLESCTIEYELTTEVADKSFRREKLLMLLGDGKSMQEALKEATTADIDELIAASDQARKYVEAFDLTLSDNGKVSSTIYDTEALLKGNRKVRYRAVFDGTRFRTLSLTGLTGAVGLGLRDDCIPGTRPEQLLYVAGKPLLELLRSGEVDVLRTRIVDGDILCDVRHPWPGPNSEPAGYVDITFNLSKSVWPVLIQDTTINGDSKILTSVVEVDSFLKSGSFYYPASITRRTFGGMAVFGNEHEALIETEKCVVARFEINPSLSDADFALEFPKGTSYLDRETGDKFHVREVGDVITMEEFRKEFNRKARAAQVKLPPPPGSFGTFRIFLVTATIALGCFAVARLLLRRYEQSKSA